MLLGIESAESFPHIFYRENCADMGLEPADVDAAPFAAAKALAITGTHLSTDGVRAASRRAIALAKQHGLKVVLDIDYRPVLWGLAGHGGGAEREKGSADVTRQMQAFLPDCDLVVGTEEEIRVAGGGASALEALRAIRARTARDHRHEARRRRLRRVRGRRSRRASTRGSSSAASRSRC